MIQNEENKFEVSTPRYSISQAAELLHISVHTLRMYEKEGLIIPFQKESSHRLYSQEDLDRLNCIRNGINEHKMSINGIKALYSLIPCWEIKKCSDDDRMTCAAYNSHSMPCWIFNHHDNICGSEVCRTCSVYKDFTDCHSVKEKIKNIIKSK